MRHEPLREYLTNPHDFDGWLKANVFVGSIVAAVVLTMALAALYSGAHQTRSNFQVSIACRAVRTDRRSGATRPGSPLCIREPN